MEDLQRNSRKAGAGTDIDQRNRLVEPQLRKNLRKAQTVEPMLHADIRIIGDRGKVHHLVGLDHQLIIRVKTIQSLRGELQSEFLQTAFQNVIIVHSPSYALLLLPFPPPAR